MPEPHSRMVGQCVQTPTALYVSPLLFVYILFSFKLMLGGRALTWNCAGTIHIVVKEAMQLGAHDPYVKLYLSKNNKDTKGML